MKQLSVSCFDQRSIITIVIVFVGFALFATACTESALVAPVNDDFEESDVWSRTMALPVASKRADQPDIYVIVEYPPRLIGGLKGLQEQMVYPEEARQGGIEGRVFLQFVVEADGTTAKIGVTRGIGSGCDEEAVRMLSVARFVPGVEDGHRVPVKMSLPITFRLVDSDSE